jgi:hypothetical protein
MAGQHQPASGSVALSSEAEARCVGAEQRREAAACCVNVEARREADAACSLISLASDRSDEPALNRAAAFGPAVLNLCNQSMPAR